MGDASPAAGDALVALLGDHGWKLGELGGWGKHSLATHDTHVPLLLAGHRQLPAGAAVGTPCSLLDVFPTLIAAAALPPDPSDSALAGRSLLLSAEQGAASRPAPARGGRRLSPRPAPPRQKKPRRHGQASPPRQPRAARVPGRGAATRTPVRTPVRTATGRLHPAWHPSPTLPPRRRVNGSNGRAAGRAAGRAVFSLWPFGHDWDVRSSPCIGHAVRTSEWTLVQWVHEPLRCTRHRCSWPAGDYVAAWRSLRRAAPHDRCARHADLFRGAPATAHAIGAEPDAANLIRHYPAVAARLRALLAAHLGVPASHVGPSLRTSRPPGSRGGSAFQSLVPFAKLGRT